MAFPHSVAGLLTRAVSILPKPDRGWKQQFMAFPLYASALFFSLLGNQVG